MLDLLIRGGTVIDGTGAPGFSADVAVEGGVIAAVEPLPPDTPARRVIHAAGKLVTPGFIDIHRHADAAAFRPGFGELELRQGLTTIVNGNCGLSAAPFGPAHREEILAYLAPITGEAPPELETETLAGYFASQPPAPIHTGMLVGAGVLRADAAGYALQRLEKRHYDAIHRSMERALSDGAVGVSLGLGYAPECFYTTRELIEALRPLSGGDVPVTVHMRQEGAGVVDSVREMLTVARTLRIPLQISHLKAMGRDSWGKKIPQVLELLEEARQEGLDVGCDVYPYTAGSTQLLHILPPEFLAGGMEAVVRRLSDPAARRELAQRIQSGAGFDDIARLAGWDGIQPPLPGGSPLSGEESGGDRRHDGTGSPDLLLRPAGAGAGGDHYDRLHGLGGGHHRHSAKSPVPPDLRCHLSHGGDAPPTGVRYLPPAFAALCPGERRADVGAGHPQDDRPSRPAAAAGGKGCAGGGDGRRSLRI